MAAAKDQQGRPYAAELLQYVWESRQQGLTVGTESGHDSEYGTGNWEFRAKKHSGNPQRMENFWEETSGIREDSGRTDLIDFSLKANRGDQTSPGKGWRMSHS